MKEKEFKNHIYKECFDLAGQLEKLYYWCQMNCQHYHGASPFEKIVELKSQLMEFARAVKFQKPVHRDT